MKAVIRCGLLKILDKSKFMMIVDCNSELFDQLTDEIVLEFRERHY